MHLTLRESTHPLKTLRFSSFCRVYNKTLEYVKTFAKFNTTDSASAVRECVFFISNQNMSLDRKNLCFFFLFFFGCTFSRTLRREPALTQFETAQIANLCPADSEEAKSVIPRYAKKNKKKQTT